MKSAKPLLFDAVVATALGSDFEEDFFMRSVYRFDLTLSMV